MAIALAPALHGSGFGSTLALLGYSSDSGSVPALLGSGSLRDLALALAPVLFWLWLCLALAPALLGSGSDVLKVLAKGSQY